MTVEEETLKTILSGVYNNSFFGGNKMSFDEALIRMRQGQKVTRRKYKDYMQFGIETDCDGNPCYVKHVKVSKPDEEERWRAYIVSHICIHDIFATDWEVCDGSAV